MGTPITASERIIWALCVQKVAADTCRLCGGVWTVSPTGWRECSGCGNT